MASSNNSFEIRLKNAEGVPIIQLGGNLTGTALKAVKCMLERLAGAGHYNIVLNVERAKAPNMRDLKSLAKCVRSIRAHYGAVVLVASEESVGQLLNTNGLAALFRFCRSEPHAISSIKRLARAPDGISNTNARLLEQL